MIVLKISSDSWFQMMLGREEVLEFSKARLWVLFSLTFNSVERLLPNKMRIRVSAWLGVLI